MVENKKEKFYVFGSSPLRVREVWEIDYNTTKSNGIPRRVSREAAVLGSVVIANRGRKNVSGISYDCMPQLALECRVEDANACRINTLGTRALGGDPLDDIPGSEPSLFRTRETKYFIEYFKLDVSSLPNYLQ